MKENIKKLWSLVALLTVGLLTAASLTACGDDDDDEPGNDPTPTKYDSRLTQQIPEEYLDKLAKYMDINQGSTPGSVEGVYLYCPKVVYDETGSYSKGHQMAAQYMRFSSQNKSRNTLTVETKFRSNETSKSTNAVILGNGNSFTIFYISEGTQSGISFKTADILSGKWSDVGIIDLQSATVVLSKGSDPTNKIMPVGSSRVFEEGYNPVSYTREESDWTKGFEN